MAAQEAELDTISNNLANANTIGFKKSRADFQDLVYQTVKAAGTQTTATTVAPTGTQIGSGVRLAATTRIFAQGAIQNTNNPLDVAIEGNGFFVVSQPDGTPAYTRAGTLKTDATGKLCTSEGMPLEPPVTIPPDATSVTIGSDGTVSVVQKNQTAANQIGAIQVANFVNPAGLNAAGHNLFTASSASGEAQVGAAGSNGSGTLLQGSLEHSNVEVVEEMIGLISAQRAYEINTKVITAADEMLQSASQLR